MKFEKNDLRYYKKVDHIPLHKFFHMNTSLSQNTGLLLNNNIQNIWKNSYFCNKFNNNNIVNEESNRNIIKLPTPQSEIFKDKRLNDYLMNRRSERVFQKSYITLEQLSTILYYSFGISKVENIDGKKIYFYMYPSAGGLNPLRIYIGINTVKSINKGIYLYNPYNNCLIEIKKEFEESEYKYITQSHSLSKNSNFSIHIVGNMDLTGYKYGDRAYRFMNLEAGHAAQNLYLVLQAFDLSTVASGGFMDANFFEYLGLNESDNFLLYELFVGEASK